MVAKILIMFRQIPDNEVGGLSPNILTFTRATVSFDLSLNILMETLIANLEMSRVKSSNAFLPPLSALQTNLLDLTKIKRTNRKLF